MLAADSSTPEHVRLAGVEMKAVQPVALLPADVDIVYAHPKSCMYGRWSAGDICVSSA